MSSLPRDRCYACYRPSSHCYCAAVPSIANRTEVLILQHQREHWHPFNTARIVHQALQNSRLLVDYAPQMAARLSLKPRSGLLYPGPDARLIGDLQPDERPEQLVVVDGTWHHAKTLVRDIPALRALPRYQIEPASPSRYRIRREPTAQALSTIEATVAALQVLEPETVGWEQLLSAFDGMVERQLAQPHVAQVQRFKQRPPRTFKNVPLALQGDPTRIVAAYGECAPAERGVKRHSRAPIYWVAERLGSQERFATAIQPASPLPAEVLAHLELCDGDFTSAMSLEEFSAAWSAFLRPGDTLAVFNPGVANMHRDHDLRATPCLVLKSVDLQPDRACLTLDKLLAAAAITPPPAQLPGRAGQRLANLVAYIQHLQSLATSFSP